MDPLEKLRTMRDGLGGVVELLVALLDDIDPDPDLEDSDEDAQVDDHRCDVADSGDDEPYLADSPGWGEPDLELDDSDREPSLGRLETIDQTGNCGDTSDGEVCILGEPHDSDEGLI